MGNLSSSKGNFHHAQIALQNHLVLKGIMKYLEVPDLLKCRLVSRLWSSIATEYLGVGGSIWIQLSAPFSHLKEIGRFLSTHRITHGLILSFCTPPWLENKVYAVGKEIEDVELVRKDKNDLYKDRWRINNYDQEILEYISESGDLVDELRLEMKYMGASDSAFLIEFHTHLKNCETVYLSIVDFNEEGWNSTRKWVPDSVTTLGMSVAGGPQFRGMDSDTVLSLSNCMQFLKGCSTANIQTMDFEGLNCFFLRGERLAWRLSLLEALATICRDDLESFPKLECIRHEITWTDNTNMLQNFPRDLKRLHLYTDMEFSTGFLPVLLKHAPTLELLDLEHRRRNKETVVEVQNQLVLPPMSHLKRLDIICDGKLCWEGWDEEKMDVLGLRRILTDENFPLKFPLLETLSAFFFRDLNNHGYDIWHWIFPDNLKNCGIKVLNVSMVVDDCSFLDPEIQRIITMFPSLKIFRHVLVLDPDDDDKYGFCYFVACEHRIHENSQSCRIINKWSPVHAKKFPGYKTPDMNLMYSRLRDQLGGDGNLFWRRDTYPCEGD